jgi:hypothetical protein
MAFVNVADFVAETTFFNPYSADEADWDYGFMFRVGWMRSPDARETASRSFNVVLVRSNRRWEHHIVVEGNWELLESGSVPSNGIETRARGSNSLKLIVAGDNGWLIVNDELRGSISLSRPNEFGGDVVVATGSYNEQAGASTRFEGFTVTPVSRLYGPIDGDLMKVEGSITIRSSETRIKDFVVEAQFYNPSPIPEGYWSYGFLIRRSSSNTFDAVLVRMSESTSSSAIGTWYHYTRSGSVESSIKLASGSVRVNAGPRDSNHLRLIAIGEKAWLFVNDRVVPLNLGVYGVSGDVGAISGYFSDGPKAGSVTRFREFTVWSPVAP